MAISESASPLRAPAGSPSFPKLEEGILAFWESANVYARSLDARRDAPSFVFFEGPPTANGLPHPGHCLTRAIKDVFPRYKTMKGFRCERKAGWDTHGLPVEVEVGKELGIHSRDEIVNYGEEPFIQKCQQSVFRYMQQWQQMTKRLGFWVDLEDAYVTYHQSYVESVWWSLKNLFDRGLLYKGHKIVWWWAQGGTALSSGEVGEGYRETADPSVYVLFPLVDHPGRSLVVWTTTPWTLPSNFYAAVHPTKIDYVVVKDQESGHELVLAEALVESLATKLKRELPIVERLKAADLVGKQYRPPFDGFVKSTGNPKARTVDDQTEQSFYWRILAADFVTTDSGTGIVHLAPAFGETDYDVFAKEQLRFDPDNAPELLHCVGPDGKFTDAFPPQAGVWVKDADKPITRLLKESGSLLHLEQYLHDYPFCWRAKDDPLIQYPRDGWFIRTTQFKDLMLENNRHIGWMPEHIRDGRFGNFLESNVDWALSRERFWGTPLPIWVCQATGQMQAMGSYEELMSQPGISGTEVWLAAKAAKPDLVDDLKIHKPYIDAITFDSPFQSGARMKRVSEVIDCWYDSGAMPFAQWGWPHQNDAKFRDQFPADFISEALDQTRGWFYSQLAISTMLFGKGASLSLSKTAPDQASASLANHAYPMPFRNCIVLGLMLGEDGNKMSKKDRNYREPNEIFDKYGADALRWFLYSGQTPWTAIRYKEQTIKDSIPEFLLRLWNCFSFMTIYAEMDGFDPASATSADENLSPQSLASSPSYRPISQRSEIDRWVISELHRTIAIVTDRMDAFDNYNACKAINDLVDGLSNWYVRRTRDRFWSPDKKSPDKLDAYWTLYETLIEVTKMIAPFTPFIAETLWRHLVSPFGAKANDSVHLTDYPVSQSALVDNNLSRSMTVLREIASQGRAARAAAKLKVRIPLAQVEVVLTDDREIAWLRSHDALVREELNVKSVDYTTSGDQYVQYNVIPNFRRLGPKVGKAINQVKQMLGEMDGGKLLAQLQSTGTITLNLPDGPVELNGEDIEVRLQAREGWAAAQGPNCVVVLNTEVTDELSREGIARDVIRAIQSQRKTLDCRYDQRIEVGIVSQDAETNLAVKEHRELIAGETLADMVTDQAISGVEPVDAECAAVYVKKVP
jgi:isoleucyl-tRNA synthetase